MMNVLNGGAHAANTIDVQEFMILPLGAPNFQEAVRWCAEVYAALRTNLHRSGLSTAVGDEGGFAPDLPNSEAAIRCLLEAIESAGFRPGADFMLALDAAANEWATGASGEYALPKAGFRLHTCDLIEHWKTLCAQYPIASLEDPLGEEDWEGWQVLTQELGGRVQLVGDDLFVTNVERLQRGLQQGCANSILIKPNQAGTLTEAMEAARLARRAGYTAIASHRSGETEDCVGGGPGHRPERRAYQNGRALPRRAHSQIQPPAARRRGTGPRRRLSRVFRPALPAHRPLAALSFAPARQTGRVLLDRGPFVPL